MSIIVQTLPGEVRSHSGTDIAAHYPRWGDYLRARGVTAASRQPVWLGILQDGLGHVPYCLEVVQGTQTRGLLPLAYMHSWFFGRFLVSLPYLNTAGGLANDEAAGRFVLWGGGPLAGRVGGGGFGRPAGKKSAHA